MEKTVNANLPKEEKSKIGGRLLQAFREALQIEDKAEIARLLGYEGERRDGVVYKIVKGKQELNFSKLEKFNQVTGFSIQWLITGDLPKIAKRVDFKNLWKRLVEAWERAAKDDRSLTADLKQIKEMSERESFLPDFNIIERASNITQTPILWLLTGEGPSQGKPLDNAPAYLADLIVDYKAKAELPQPLKREIMISAQKSEDSPLQFRHTEGSPNIPFSAAEDEALNKLAGEKGQTVAEKIRELVLSQLLAQGAISLKDVATGLQMTPIVAKVDEAEQTKKRA